MFRDRPNQIMGYTKIMMILRILFRVLLHQLTYFLAFRGFYFKHFHVDKPNKTASNRETDEASTCTRWLGRRIWSPKRLLNRRVA